MRTRELIETTRQILSDSKDIAAVYVFGSIVRGLLTPFSDLDIAILFREGLVPDTLGVLQLRERLTSTLGIDVDIACLNTAGPILALQVLRKGEKIIEHDTCALAQFIIRAVNAYDDLKRIRRPIERQILLGRVYS
jgi:predicted nucleotidyltransferase